MSGIDRTTCERDGAGDDGNKQQFFSQMPTYAVIGGGGMLLGGGAWAGYYRQKFRQKMGEVPLKRPSGSSVSVASKNRAHQLGFNPYTLAFRALGYGTLISVSAFVVGCTGIGWAMGVRDLKGFGDVMKVYIIGVELGLLHVTRVCMCAFSSRLSNSIPLENRYGYQKN